MKDITKNYSNGEVTIIWKPSLCIHSTICWKGDNALATVFDPRVRPWIKPEGADTARIIEQVKKCPSGALSFFMNAEGPQETMESGENIVEAIPNGPLMVYGNFTLKDKNGEEKKSAKVTALCRCGASANKPYCDGSHVKINFTTDK
jgi:uncharacterized Fe-S cluster protein YjdI